MVLRIYYTMIVGICIFCLQSYSKDTDTRKSEIKFHDRVYYDVFLNEKGKERNITNFRAWEYIDDSKLSPDGKLLCVRHKPQSGRRLILSVYDVNSGKVIGRRKAGFGGILSWCGNSKIVHIWGCGTNCYNVLIYNPQLGTIPFPDLKVTDLWGGCVLSPGHNFILMYSMRGFGYCLVDLLCMTVADYSQPDIISEDSETIESVSFCGEEKILFKIVNRVSGESYIRTIEINSFTKKKTLK